MIKTKTFNYQNKIINYGFIELERENSAISIEMVAESTKDSLFIVDTNGSVLLSILKKIESYLNQNEKILVGLTNEKTLSELRKNGVSNGLFRSTEEKINVALIIQDKKTVYLAFDESRILEVPSKYSDEIFEYVNHVFWSKTRFENLQGSLSEIKEARLSVVVPQFLNDFDTNASRYEYATEDYNQASCIILNSEKELHKDAIVIPYAIKALSLDKTSLYINVFNDQYYSISEINPIISAQSFKEQSLSNLLRKNVWHNGKTNVVTESETITYQVEVPFDQVESYEPDYSIYETDFKGLTLELNVLVNVNPIQVDGSYSLSKKYGIIQKAEDLLENNLEKLEKLELDKKYAKQLESIRSERLLINKIKMFNSFVSNKDYGVDALNNKKSPVSSINVNEDDLNVPNELIGRLYTKQGKDYLATTKEHINDAKTWLKENKMEAILIKA